MQRNVRRRLLYRALSIGLLAASVLIARPNEASAQDWSADNSAERRQEIIRRYREILERRPEEGRIFDMLMQEVGSGAALDRLLAEYQQLADATPDNFAYAMLLGHLLRRTDRFEEARAAYERARDLAPGDPLPWRALGRVYGRLDLRAESEAAWEQALTLATDVEAQREILRELADLALAARDWERAGGYFDRLVALEPGNVYIRMELAETLVRYERYDEALEQYEAIANAAGTDTRQRAVATRDIGEVLMLMGRADEAVETYRAAMRLVEPGYWLHRELQLRIVDVYRRDDRLDEYVEELEQSLRSPSFDDLMLLASLYDETGRDNDALQALRRAVERNSGSVDARLALIRVLERRGDTEGVIEEYRSLIRSNPSDSAFRFRLVDVLRRSGDRDGAIEMLDEMASRFASDAYTLVEVADRYMRFREPEKAGPLYERLVRLAPDDPNHLVALGDWHFLDGRRSEAERIWRGILDIVQPEHEARATLAEVFADHGLAEEAILEFEAALEAQPGDEAYIRSLARLYGEAGRVPQSLRLWEQLHAASDQPQLRAEARTAMIRGWDTLGRLQEKLASWQEDFDATPPVIESGYLVAEGALFLADETTAETAWLSLLEIDPNDLIALTALDRLYTQQNRIEDAIAMLLRITEVSPQRAREALHRLADLSLRVFDDEAAVRFAAAAVELNPDDASARARLADVYRQMQRYDDAIAQYREAIDLDPRAFAVYFQLADVYQTVRAPVEANTLYRRVLAESGDETQILRAGRRALRIDQASQSLDSFIPLLEERLYDATVGEAFLKLAIEAWDARTQPILRVAAWGSADEQGRARSELAELGRRAQRPLLDALAGDDVSMRGTALRLLSALRSPGAATAIARIVELPGASDEERTEAVVALALLADPRTSNDLVRAVANAPAARALVAIWALGRIGDATALEALRTLADDPQQPPEQRALAIFGLGRATAPDSADAAIIARGFFGEDAIVRQASLLAAAFSRQAALAQQIVVLMQHGQDADPAIAAWVLGVLPDDPAHKRALLDAWLQGPDRLSDAALAAARHAGRVRTNPAAVSAWEERLSYYSAAAQVFDVSALFSGLLSESLLERVDATSEVSSDAVRAALTNALRGGGAPTATVLNRVRRAVDDPASPPMLRTELRAALTGATVTLVQIAAENRVPEARAAALAALAYIEEADENVLRTVRNLAVEDISSDVRRSAVRTAGALRDPGISGVVGERLDAADWQDRAVAVEAAGRAGLLEHADRLQTIADADTFATVRGAAWNALLRLREAPTCDALVADWTNIDAATRLGAIAELGSLSEPCAARLAELASSDPDARVRARVNTTSANR